MFSAEKLNCSLSSFVCSVLYSTDRPCRIARCAAVAVMSAGCFAYSTINAAWAQQDLKAYSTAVSTKTNILVDIVSYGCYIGGAILSAVGIIDLKKHVEQPAQNPLKNGLAKLGFGGILLALPFVSGIMAETMKGEGQATYQGFERGRIQIQ